LVRNSNAQDKRD